MATFRLDVRSEDIVLKWLADIPPTMNQYMRVALQKAGVLLRDTARAITLEEDAIGATRDYLEGWKYTPEDIRDDGAFGFLYNDSDHAYWAEHGRGAGGMPPQKEVEEWMASKGIPLEVSYVIRRAIAESGTIKKKGYKGYEIMQQTFDMVGDDALDELEYGFIRATRALA